MAAARRLYCYLLAFAGLLVVLSAASGLLAVLATSLLLRPDLLVGGAATRSQVSFYLAALIVGLPVFLGHWRFAERRAAGSAEERHAGQRRLFYAAVYGATAIVTLFALRDVLRYLFGLPGAPPAGPSPATALSAAARLLLYGVAWQQCARLARRSVWREGAAPAADPFFDLARYTLIAVALGMYAVAAGQALRQALADLLALPGLRPVILPGSAQTPWVVWSAVGAALAAGGGVWAAAWRADLGRRSRHLWRVRYLYLVLLVATPTALGAGGYVLAELLRRLFGYRPTPDTWDFLRDGLPVALVAALVAVYHMLILRRQAAYAPPSAATPGRGVAWPRRPALALLAFLGLAVAATALISLLWLGLDLALVHGPALGDAAWRRDRLSWGLAGALVGLPVWYGAWSAWQRGVASDPARERATTERRVYLGGVAVLGVLATVGFAIALLWLGLRAALGDALSPGALSLACKEASTALIAIGIAAVHGALLRADLAAAGPGAAKRPRVLALVGPGADELLAELRGAGDLQIDVIGRLAADAAPADLAASALRERLAALKGDDGGAALLLLSAQGGKLIPYRAERDFPA